MIFAGPCARVIVWRGFGTKGKLYPLDRERARRLGQLLDGDAELKRINGELAYVWDDWNWDTIAKGGR